MSSSKKTRENKSGYVKVPTAPQDVARRLHVVILVQTGQMTVSDAGKTLGMSRNHFQSLKNKCLESMLQALTPKPAGRPSRNQQVVHLQKQVDELSRDNEQLQQRVQAMDRIIDSLTGMVREQNAALRRTPRKRRRSPNSDKEPSDPGED